MERSVAVAALLAASLGAGGASQERNVSTLRGYVLTSEWLPVSGGTVKVQSLFSERIVSIGSNGRFNLESLAPGSYNVYISAPSLVARQLRLEVAAVGNVMLPPIRLSAPSYVRLRLLSPTREPITWPRVLRESFNVDGSRIPEAPGEWTPAAIDPDGTTTIGPLPQGITVLASDTPPFARQRIRDVRISGESRLIDVGTLTLDPGATLNVQLLDGAGAPVPDHEVMLDEAVALSPIWYPAARTNALGRVSFERLAGGRYTVRARALRQCSRAWPTAARTVDVPSGGTVRITLVLDGVLRLRVTTAGVPLTARSVSITSDVAAPAAPPWLRNPSSQNTLRDRMRLMNDAPCAGVTDGDGRVTLPVVPPGSARAAVRLSHSIWVRRIQVAGDGREVNVEIPSGVLPVRVTGDDTQGPVAGAAIAWTAGGATVEASTSATGEALVEAVAPSRGRLTVSAANYRTRAMQIDSPSDMHQEISLQRAGGVELRCRVVTREGEPIVGAVVEMTPHDRLATTQIVTTDSTGVARFYNLPPGPLRLSAWADGFAASALASISARHSDDVPTVIMSRGYRVHAAVGANAGEGPHVIRIVSETGTSMEEMLDAASDRSITGGGQVSLGPLAPGAYFIELRNAREHRRERVRIDDRDVQVTFR